MAGGQDVVDRSAGEAVPQSQSQSRPGAEPEPVRTRRYVVETPDQLPALPGHFVGRGDQLARLLGSPPDPDRPAVSVIDGMPGIGKSALAVLTARRLAQTGRYPDGTLFIDLQGYSGNDPTTPADALGALLHGLRVPDAEIPFDLDARIGLYRSATSARRVLIVLDNARDEAQVRPLLPGAATCAVLVTSRRRLAGLDDADHLTLDPLHPADAARLFRAVVGPGRDLGSSDTMDRIVRICGCLPLAVRIAAARLRASASWIGPDLADRLMSADARLAELDDGERSVTAAFATSFQQLRDDQQRALILLSLHPGTDCERFATAALLDTTAERAVQLLAQLERVSLVHEPNIGRYRFHDLIRGFARAAAQAYPDTDRQRALDRLYDLYAHTTAAAVALVHPHQAGDAAAAPPAASPPLPDQASARNWLDAERANLITVAHHAGEHHRLDHTVRQSRALHHHLRTQGQYAAAAQLHRRALGIVEAAGDLRSRVSILNDLGEIHYVQDEYDLAVKVHTQALDGARAVGDRVGETDALNGLGHTHLMLGQQGEAAEAHGRALHAARDAGYRLGEMQALAGLGRVCYVQGSLAQANDHLTQALEIAREVGHRAGEVSILMNLGHLHYVRGEHEPAGRYFAEVLATARAGGDERGTLNALNGLGWVAASEGTLEIAAQHHSEALELARTIGHRLGELISLAGLGDVHLAGSRHSLAVECFTQVRDLAEETGIRNYAYEAQLGLGRAHLGDGHPSLAVAAHQQALSLAVTLEQPSDQVRAHDGIALAARAMGDAPTARHHWQTALDLLDSLDTPAADDVTATDIRAHLIALDDPSAVPTHGDRPAAGEVGTTRAPSAHPKDTGSGSGPPTAADPEPTGVGSAAAQQPAAADAKTPRGPSEPRAVICARHGHGWRLDDGERSVLVRHSVGMLHLAVLLANPHRDIPCIDLAAGVAAVEHAADHSTHHVLDDTAIRQYRRRIEQLSEQVLTLEARGQTAKALEVHAELDWLVGAVAAATGITGRPRGFPDNSERARVAVTRAIHRAMARIYQADPQIGEHLRQSIRTGVHCSYRPVPPVPVSGVGARP